MMFPNANIRFVAINDGVDSSSSIDNDFTPFRNIINEWYAKDVSKKVTSAMRVKGESGKPLTTKPPMGYMKDPEDKFKWIVDEVSAPTVKLIFRLCVAGHNAGEIATILNEQGYNTPNYHHSLKGKKIYSGANENVWLRSVVLHILKNINYTGAIANFKTKRVSYKNKRIIRTDASEWKIFENMHEPLIDKETFNLVQDLVKVRRMNNKYDDINIFAGLLKCADCGASVNLKRVNHNRAHDYYICSGYTKHTKNKCTQHYVSNTILTNIVLADIQKVLAHIKNYESEFVEDYKKYSLEECKKLQADSRAELRNGEIRIEELNTIISSLYEDKVLGRITDDRFQMFSQKYEKEQAELMSKIKILKDSWQIIDEEENNIKEFIKLVRTYTDIQELDFEILHNLIDRIIISEREDKAKMRRKGIKIIYKFVGAVNLPN